MDTNQRRDASEIKTHEEILALFRELDRIGERVKNLQLSNDEDVEVRTVLHEVKKVEPPVTIPRESQVEKSIDSILLRKQKSPLFAYEWRHKGHVSRKKIKRSILLEKEHTSNPRLSPETAKEPQSETKETAKPVTSTFTLHINEDGTLGGFPLKKPQLSPDKGFFGRRRQRTETEEKTEETPASGFKGRMARLFSKIIPRRSKEEGSRSGVGGKIKGIFKRGSKEEQ